MTQAASAKDATARVFKLAITVTQAQPAGARPIAMLSRSQQNTWVIVLSILSPALTARTICLSTNV